MNKEFFVNQIFTCPFDLATLNAATDFLQDQKDDLGFAMAEILTGTKKAKDFPLPNNWSIRVDSDIIHLSIDTKLYLKDHYLYNFENKKLVKLQTKTIYEPMWADIDPEQLVDCIIEHYANGRGNIEVRKEIHCPAIIDDFDIMETYMLGESISTNELGEKLNAFILYICECLATK